jgi:hypothetical protein
MVDPDKVRDRTGGSSKKKKKKKKKKGKKNAKQKKQTKEGQSSDESATAPSDRGESRDFYGDKMEQLKGGSSSSTSTSGDGVDRGDVANALECLANILFYSEGKMRSFAEPSTKRERVQTNVTTKIYEQFTDIIARRDVQAICEKYNVDWEEDVLQNVIADQDFEGGAEYSADTSDYVSDLSGMSNMKKVDYHSILMAVGECFMFAKMVENNLDPQSDTGDKMAEGAVTDISAKCIDFIGSFDLVNISKQNGISWEQDVLANIGQ